MTDVVALAAEPLALPSTTGSEEPVVDLLSRWLVQRGWSGTVQEVSPGRGNVRASGADGGVTRSTQLDTVPADVAPRLDAERLHRRDACDAKGIAAATLAAADRLPTLRTLPLPSDPICVDTTYNIGVIRGDTEANVVPAEAEAELLFRLVGDAQVVRATLVAWAGDRAELEWGATIPAQRFHTIDGFGVAAVAHPSDIPLLDRRGTPPLFGPGRSRSRTRLTSASGSAISGRASTRTSGSCTPSSPDAAPWSASR